MQNSGNRERGSLPGVRSALTSFLRSPPNDLFDSLSLAVFTWFGHCDPGCKLGSTEEAPRLYVFVSGGFFSGVPAITSFSWEAPVNPIVAGASSHLNQRVGAFAHPDQNNIQSSGFSFSPIGSQMGSRRLRNFKHPRGSNCLPAGAW